MLAKPYNVTMNLRDRRKENAMNDKEKLDECEKIEDELFDEVIDIDTADEDAFEIEESEENKEERPSWMASDLSGFGSGHGFGEFDLQKMMADIDRRIAELDAEEKRQKNNWIGFTDKLRETLTERGIFYTYDTNRPRLIEVAYKVDKKPLTVKLTVDSSGIRMSAVFPFAVQSKALALTAIYVTRFNCEEAFSRLDLDLDDGELTLDHTCRIRNEKDYDADEILVSLGMLVDKAVEIYVSLHNLSVGKVSAENRELYTRMIEMSMAALDGVEEDEDDIEYGIDRSRDFPGKKLLIKKAGIARKIPEFLKRRPMGSPDSLILPGEDSEDDEEKDGAGEFFSPFGQTDED